MRRLWLLLLLPLAACGEARDAPSSAEPWVTYEDTARAYRISYPASWQRAGKPLTPRLMDPHEILTLGTHRLRPGGERCNHVPENAMRDLRRGDVLLTLQERRGSGGFGDRPRPFRLSPSRPSPPQDCAGRTDISESQDGFRDAGRGLHVFTTFGPEAEAARRTEVERVVESLVLEPAWRSRGLDVRMQPPTGWRVKARGSHFNFGSWDVPPPPDQQCALPRGARDLPADGAFAFVFEYVGLNRTQRMRFPGFQRFSLRPKDRRAYECFGDSWLFRWRERGRTFQAHAYLGPEAGANRRAELRAALRSIVTLRR
jgi:hypothetical protein